jgi:predicted nucleic acid-binding Zn ribbon protein
MIVCHSCGAALPNNAKFCKECGAEVPDNIKFCSNCHADIPENSKFCTECGQSVEEKKGNAFSVLLVLLMLIGAGFVVYRSIDIPQQSFLPNIQNSTVTKKDSEQRYEEVAFDKTLFLDQVVNSIKIDVIAPTTQALIIKHANEWLHQKLESGKIKEDDINKLEIFEKNELNNESNKRANIIRVNLELNPDYNFPKGTYSNIGNNIYINWTIKEE